MNSLNVKKIITLLFMETTNFVLLVGIYVQICFRDFIRRIFRK